MQTVTEVVVEDLAGMQSMVTLPAGTALAPNQQIVVATTSAEGYTEVPATILQVPAEIMDASGQQRTIIYQQKH